MKGIINLESIWRRSLKSLGLYYKWLFYKARTSPTEKMQKVSLFYSDFIKQDDLCFDIGANMGSRINTFLMLGAKVIAVEPQKNCYKELQKVYKDYPVTLVQKGVGSVQGVKEFYIANNSLISSFSKEWIEEMKKKHTKNNWDRVEQMEITTLDALIKEYGNPDFIKIDTEGFEQEVLKGLSTVVKALSFEYTLPDKHRKAVECLSLVKALYKDNALYNISRDEDYKMHFRNWVKFDVLKDLLLSKAFDVENFGNYGDIYVKQI